MPDLQQWPTKPEVRQRLNISDRAVDRLVQQEKLQRLERAVYGRRPVPIFNPSDVDRLAEASPVKRTDWLPVDSPLPEASPAPEQAIAKNGHSKPNPQLAALIAEFIQILRDFSVANAPTPTEIASLAPAVPAVPATLYLTMSEASLYSGLPEGRLRAFLKQGKLTRIAGAHNRTMISRGELENLWKSFASCAALECGTEGGR
jgi:hypothetical protein